MAVAFRAGSARTDNFSSVSPVVTKGTNIVDGDLIVLWFASDSAHARGAATLNGFTDHGVLAQSTDSSVSLLTKVASGEGASWTFTNLFAASESGITGQVAYSGVDTGNVFAAGPTGNDPGSGAGELLSASITPAVDNCMIVAVGGGDPGADPRTWTPDSSPAATERVDAQNALLGFVYGQEFLQTTAAAVQLGATPSASEGIAWWIMALRPASADIQKTLTPVTESDVVQALTKTQQAISVSITPATTTDSSQSLGNVVGPAISKAITAATETDTAQVLSFTVGGGDILVSITPATTMDAAQALGSTQQAITVNLTAALESDSAQSLGFTQAAISVTITPAIEFNQAVVLDIEGAIEAVLRLRALMGIGS